MRFLPKFGMPALHRFYLTIFRFVGFLVLVGSMSWLFGYGFILLFFIFNTNWVAPTVLTPTSDRMLQFSSGYEQAQQNYSTLLITHNQAVREYGNTRANYENLMDLAKETVTYSDKLHRLGQERGKQFSDSRKLDSSLKNLRDATARNLHDGLVTSEEATSTVTSIQSFKNLTTQQEVEFGATTLTAEVQEVNLTAQLMQAKSDLATKRETVMASEISLMTAKKTLDALEESAYKKAFDDHGSTLMFVSYDNVKAAKVGAPIYDCYLMIVACHKVGTITHIYKDEQIVDFPLFNVRLTRTVRGTFAEAQMDRVESMRSTVLFVGSKPLVF